MKNGTRKTLVGMMAVAALFAAGLGQAQADLIYDNGPINGSIVGFGISNGQDIEDTFTVSGPTTFTSAQAGLWVDIGATPTSVDWAIGTTPGGSDISSGTASPVNTFWGQDSGENYDIYEAVFPITGSLGAGTYWFTLQNAVASDQPNVFWDVNNGPSAAAGYGGTVPLADYWVPGSNSESFQLYGTAAGVPEPSIVLMMAFGGLAMLGAHRRMRK